MKQKQTPWNQEHKILTSKETSLFLENYSVTCWAWNVPRICDLLTQQAEWQFWDTNMIKKTCQNGLYTILPQMQMCVQTYHTHTT